ncbi:glutathione peroxidase [Pseudomonas fulva]|uniref:Glutathione peroxidase n=1 Tax=Pseudomonas parafulva TaxID=157782 RepID=A0AAJ0LGJ9_9PSED|nr:MULTISPECIES: glutathione peroxidase [Pseudomonas]AQW67863.1 glutathione peroxidase [Pseudomonas parafulva]AUA32310.1 glutathione peroxidase [Pseudomonas sp. SGAir0191]KTS92975.1 glutathione peroxidase [Pseudomonas parafulva]KTT14995.1 glutathione peroxidase [Pseudomonas parafulva]MBA5708314.1 glutathione peroxidase [Pseudomonas fulva]
MAASLLDIPCVTITGEHKKLGDFPGKAVLVVNTASQCGFTPQYAGLEQLWQRYRDRGLMVLGFPCNQFGKQEPGEARDIAQFCQRNFGVSFALFRKVEVNGPGTHPLFAELKQRAPGILGSQKIKWNFTKFLLDPVSGQVVRYAPTTKPQALEADIERLLSR